MNSHNHLKKWMLVIASYIFYSFWDWRFLLLLFFSSTGNFLAGRIIGHFTSERPRKLCTAIAVTLNLLPLAFFKYYDFGAAQIQNFCNLFGFNPPLGSTGIAVPVAISFLTFHGISYVVDVYRRAVEPTRILVDLLLYISFFPHLVAGPIVRAASFLKQLSQPSRSEDIELGKAILLIVGGLFKKVVIASHISTLYVDPIFTNPVEYSRLDLILGAYAYAIVIYCDFSAYTDIAIGIADLLGYKFPQNFNQPYRSLSLQDFWRRWHITLSSWLRDYLYIPLGGNRHGRFNTYRNLIITMVLGGLWHGAGLTFIFWGAMHGVGLAAERLAAESMAPDSNLLRFLRTPFGYVLRWLIIFNFVCVAWIFFRSETFGLAIDYLHTLWAGPAIAKDYILTGFVAALMILGFIIQFLPPNAQIQFRTTFDTAPLWLKVAVPTLAILGTAVLAPEGIAPFIYFQF